MDRRRDILNGALGAFLALGYDRTTMAEIRARSGASTGSIYHFFSGKADIARVLLEEAVAGWSVLSRPTDDPDPARAAISGSVRGFLQWGRDNPDLVRLLEDLRGREGLGDAEQRLREGQAQAAALYARWTAQGLVRAMPWPLAHALILGPAYSLLATKSRDKEGVTDEEIAIVVDAAWRAVAP